MKRFLKILKKLLISLLVLVGILLLVLITAFLFAKMSQEGAVSGIGKVVTSMAITNVNIVDVEAQDSVIQTGMTVLIDQNRITEIIPDSIEIPSHYDVVNANGKYLLPGLIDMHTHIFDRSDLSMYLSYGVTSVRNMMGFPMHLRWRQQVKQNEYPGANLITATPTINSGNNTSPFHKNISTTQEIEKAIDRYKKEGYDFIKIYDGLTTDQFNQVMASANKNQMTVSGHPPQKIELNHLLQSEFNTFEHIEEMITLMEWELDTLLGRKLAKQFKGGDAKVTVTLAPFQNIYQTTVNREIFLQSIPQELINPFVRFIGNKQLSEWVNANEGAYKWNVAKYACMEQLTKIFYEEGVTLLLGTDTGPSLTIPGVTLHDEIDLLEHVGIKPIDILKSGTIEAAKALFLEDEIGSISSGKLAQLILVNESPLEDMQTLRSPQFIVNNGMFYDRQDLVELRTLGESKTGTFLTIGRFIEHILAK